MLAALTVRDIVLIDRLELGFGPGLTVLSGETGTGKSILLDALALALGGRGDAGLVRGGAAEGAVTAAFDLAASSPVRDLLAARGIAAGEELVLRRVQYADGRTRAFVNDEPVGVRLMHDIGAALVEIHGQHDERALLEPAAHLDLLDDFAGNGPGLAVVTAAWAAVKAAEETLEAHETEIARALADADFLRHATEELRALAPAPGEESRLADERRLMLEGARVAEDLAVAHEALVGERGAEAALAKARAALARAEARAPAAVKAALDAAERAAAECGEASAEIQAVIGRAEADPVRLEQVEERLFALRAAARKHGVEVDVLAELAERLAGRLAAIESGEDRLARLRDERDAARASYGAAAGALSAARGEAARRFDAAVMTELKYLKLEAARFETRIVDRGEAGAGPKGTDRAEFMIAANPGIAPGPLRKVASGGELSRVMLALKVVLAGRGGAPSLVFDEIDDGVGGAVADAVGERLQRLGGALQVLAVTHSPQVAARGNAHFVIEKSAGKAGAKPATAVRALDAAARREEIARMLAGASVTEEARAAATRLIGTAGR